MQNSDICVKSEIRCQLQGKQRHESEERDHSVTYFEQFVASAKSFFCV